VEILKDKRGAYRRVTVEHPVLDTEPLVRLHGKLTGLTGFRAKDSSDLHLTLFHFGLPQTLYREFKALNPQLKAHDFWVHWWRLLGSTGEVLPRQFKLESDRLALFGSPDRPAISLEFKAPGWLTEARRLVEVQWQQFLQACGVTRFKTDKPFRPHVALGRAAPMSKLPRFEPVEVSFGPSRLRNVRVVK
jgi:2'-5' RNA ligase